MGVWLGSTSNRGGCGLAAPVTDGGVAWQHQYQMGVWLGSPSNRWECGLAVPVIDGGVV